MGLLVLTQTAGCKSPEDIGFDASALFTAPMAAIGVDTKTTPCDERIAMYEEFIGQEESKARRSALAEKVPDAMKDDGFDAGFDRMADIPQNIFKAFERDCPEQTPKARELALGVAKELQIESKVAWLTEK